MNLLSIIVKKIIYRFVFKNYLKFINQLITFLISKLNKIFNTKLDI
jgi:hypothetical protein